MPSGHRHLIIIDACALIPNFQLKTVTMGYLIDAAMAIGAQVCIPELVIEELVRNYRIQLDKLMPKLREQRRFQYDGEGPELPDSSSLIDGYELWLRTRIQELGIVVLPPTQAGHDKLIARLHEERKPFRPSGIGYKDALIWESVIDAAREGVDRIDFITANHKDFMLDGALHPDLLADLVAEGVDSHSAFAHISIDATTRAFENEDLIDDVDDQEASIATGADIKERLDFNQQLGTVKDEIFSALESNQYWFRDGVIPEGSSTWADVEFEELDVDFRYLGAGKWRADGIGYWEVEVEYYDFSAFSYEDPNKSETMPLAVDFTIYFDASTDRSDAPVINDVTRTDKPW